MTRFAGANNSLNQYKLPEDILNTVVESVLNTVGESFFVALVENLAKNLQMEFSSVGIRDAFNPYLMHTLAFYAKGKIIPNVIYDIRNTPCEKVLNTSFYYCTKDAMIKFPKDQMFQIEGITSYLGITLCNSSGRVLGVLNVMGTKPVENQKIAENMLKLFSVRASSELERLENVKALTASEQRFRKLAENSPDIICIFSVLEEEIKYINREQIFGYKSSELVTIPDYYKEIVHPDDYDQLMFARQQMMKTGAADSLQGEYRLKRKDGEWEWLSKRVVVMERNAAGIPTLFLVTITIITQNKKVQQALEKSKANLQALIENTEDSIWAVDLKYQVIAINSSFKKQYATLYGYALEIGDHFLSYTPEQILDYWEKLYQRAFKGERFIEEFSYEENGRTLYYEVSFNPIYTGSGRVDGASVFARNVTSKKAAEKELINANFELDSFVYRSSHDLRAPLRSVLGLVDLIRLEENPEQRYIYLDLITKSINKLDTFIVDLTNFSRNSRSSVTIKPVNFENIVCECMENLQYMPNANKLELKTSVSGTVDFYSDISRITIVFQNLISNAIKYQKLNINSAYLHIMIDINDKQAHISLTDNGIGIEEAYAGKIFEMFFRASADSYGSGLGLYITKQVVEKLKGQISVSSQLGKGTQFNITLPNMIAQSS